MNRPQWTQWNTRLTVSFSRSHLNFSKRSQKSNFISMRKEQKTVFILCFTYWRLFGKMVLHCINVLRWWFENIPLHCICILRLVFFNLVKLCLCCTEIILSLLLFCFWFSFVTFLLPIRCNFCNFKKNYFCRKQQQSRLEEYPEI